MRKIALSVFMLMIVGSANAAWDNGKSVGLNENGELLFFLFDENPANKASGVQDLGIRYDTMRAQVSNDRYTVSFALNNTVFSNFDSIVDTSTLRWGVMGYAQGFFDPDYGMMITTNAADPDNVSARIDEALDNQSAYLGKINVEGDTDFANNNAVYGTDANNRYVGDPGTLGRSIKQSTPFDTTAGITQELAFYNIYDDFTATGFEAKFAGKWILDLAGRTLSYVGSLAGIDDDADDDKVKNDVDNCRDVANTDQLNTDGDTQGNACDANDDNDANTDAEELACVSDPLDASSMCPVIVVIDTDNDGVSDSADNCPSNSNSNQLNTDGDAQGNVCDANDDNDANTDAEELACDSNPLDASSVCPLEEEEEDIDLDGVVDSLDNCPVLANDDQQDSDNDGEGDVCDATPYEQQTLTLTSSAAQDGSILESTETSKKGGKVDSKSTTFSLGDNVKDQENRAILQFDTAQLPDDAVITRATLTIKKQSAKGNVSKLGNIIVDMANNYFGKNANLATEDFNAKAGKTSVASLKVSSNTSGVLSNNGIDYISKTKPVQFRLRFNKDDNDNNVEDVVKFYSGNSSKSKPSLVIEYYVVP